jgi:hypothetical protein
MCMGGIWVRDFNEADLECLLKKILRSGWHESLFVYLGWERRERS